MSQPQPRISSFAFLTNGRNSSLVHACRTFCDRFADFEEKASAFDVAQSQDDPQVAELQACADALLTDWRQLARNVSTTPAQHIDGLRAKAKVLDVLLAQSGAEGVEAELTWSLIADLNQVGDLGPVGYRRQPD